MPSDHLTHGLTPTRHKSSLQQTDFDIKALISCRDVYTDTHTHTSLGKQKAHCNGLCVCPAPTSDCHGNNDGSNFLRAPAVRRRTNRLPHCSVYTGSDGGNEAVQVTAHHLRPFVVRSGTGVQCRRTPSVRQFTQLRMCWHASAAQELLGRGTRLLSGGPGVRFLMLS